MKYFSVLLAIIVLYQVQKKPSVLDETKEKQRSQMFSSAAHGSAQQMSEGIHPSAELSDSLPADQAMIVSIAEADMSASLDDGDLISVVPTREELAEHQLWESQFLAEFNQDQHYRVSYKTELELEEFLREEALTDDHF